MANELLTKVSSEEQILEQYLGSDYSILKGLGVLPSLVKALKQHSANTSREAINKALGYARVLQKSNGAIPWRDVLRYSKTWIDEQ